MADLTRTELIKLISTASKPLDLSWVNLTVVDLRNTNLSRDNLDSADLRNANLTGAKLEAACLSYADLL